MQTQLSEGCCGEQTDFCIVAGEAFVVPITITDDDDPPAPINITGYTFHAQINLPTPVILTTENGGITIIDAEEGKIQINISSDDTMTYPAGSYLYQMWMVPPDDDEEIILQGEFKVTQNIANIA